MGLPRGRQCSPSADGEQAPCSRPAERVLISRRRSALVLPRSLLPLPSNAKVVADVAAAIKRFFDLDGEPALTVGGYAVLPELPASIFRDDDEVHVTVAPASHPARRNPRQQSTPVAQGAQRLVAAAWPEGAWDTPPAAC